MLQSFIPLSNEFSNQTPVPSHEHSQSQFINDEQNLHATSLQHKLYTYSMTPRKHSLLKSLRLVVTAEITFA